MNHKNSSNLAVVLILCGSVVGSACGESKTLSDAGLGEDMNVDDAGDVLDGARDAENDATVTVDADGDGILVAVDCDDGDAAVGRTASAPCSSSCATGVRTCTDAVWAACDASTDCACPTAGATRTTACGNCGLQSQRCSDANVWEGVSPCLGEGECAPAAFEHDTTRCGDRARICDDACAWRPWTVTTPQGECEAPETRTPTGVTCGISEVPSVPPRVDHAHRVGFIPS